MEQSYYEQFTNKRRLEKFANTYQKSEEEQYKSFKDMLRHDELLESNSSFFNPKDKVIYFGETKKHTPTYSHAVFDTKKYNAYRRLADKAIAEGGQDLTAEDKAKYEPWTAEFAADAAKLIELNQEIDNGYLNIKKAEQRAAGYMTQADFQGLRLVAVLGQLINQEQKGYSLQNAGTKYTSTNVIFRIPSVTRFQIAEDIKELEGGVEAMKMAFTSQYIQLTKDVAHLAWSDEFQMAEYDQPIMQLHMQNATSEFERVHASHTAVQVNRLSSNNLSAGWNQYVSGTDRSSQNPVTDLAVARRAIWGNNGLMTRMASNFYTYQTYLTNSFVRGLMAIPNTVSSADPQVITGVPGQPGITWYLDELLSDGNVYTWDASALADIQGPIRTSTYRDEEIGGQGVFIRNWSGSFFLRLTQGYRLALAIQ
jgi:hypothetical protein